MELERRETLRIQKSLVRDESEIWILDGCFYKKMDAAELEAYSVLSSYQEQLLRNANMAIPYFYGKIPSLELSQLRKIYNWYISPQNLYKISFLAGVKHRQFDESYGVDGSFTSEDFLQIFKSLFLFRNIVQPKSLKFSKDYELDPQGLLRESAEVVDGFLETDSKYLSDRIGKTQGLLGQSSLVAAHRDLNWNNMGITNTIEGGKRVLQVVDWGTFGLAYAGYDEGRLFTRLALNPYLQNIYLASIADFARSNFGFQESKLFMLSFWRTVAIRSYREIFLILTGRYERPINYRFMDSSEDERKEKSKSIFYKEFLSSFETMLGIAVENLSLLLSN